MKSSTLDKKTQYLNIHWMDLLHTAYRLDGTQTVSLVSIQGCFMHLF